MCFLETFNSKYQVPKIIEDFIILVKNQTNQDISIFRSDRGTEFADADVRKVLTKYGIQREFTTPDTHHQNGVAERFIRSIKTKARILLDEFGHINKNLLKAEALKTACFLYNRTLNKSLGNKTPIEIFGKPDWDLKFLPFDTRVYSLRVNKKKQYKEEENSKLMYLVGYDLQSSFNDE